MYSEEKHLSPEQVEWLINGKGSDGAVGAPVEFWDEARQHLGQCAACEKLVHLHGEIQKRLVGLNGQSAKSSAENCPDERVWWELAAGILPEAETEKLMDHAIQCDHCAPLLRTATEDFAAGITPEEETVLEQLETAVPQRQKAVAKELAVARAKNFDVVSFPSTPTANTPRLSWMIPRWAIYSAAAALVVVLAGAWMLIELRKPSVDKLLASAYSEQRPFDLRISGAAPAPVRQQRGAAESPLSKPADLLQAELLIRQELQNGRTNPEWLAAEGRAEILEWNYDAAIKSFERALEVNPDSPDILQDLGTAHFERAEADHRAADYGEAIEYLGRALALRPNNPISLFNRAIVFQRLYMYQNAVGDWTEYLRLDPTGPWSAEARTRLAEVQKILRDHSQSHKSPVEDPAEANSFLQAQLNTPNFGTDSRNSLDEDYLDIATGKWLGSLAADLRSGRSRANSPSGQALESFSQLWKIRHADGWLVDMLSGASAAGFPSAADALSSAVTESARGNAAEALAKAELAARAFEKLGNRAGVLRARVEYVYALQRSLESNRCIQAATGAAAELAKTSYSWMKTKILLEQAACVASVANFDVAQHAIEQARKLAAQNHFGVLELRALVFANDVEVGRGDHSAAWDRGRQGLESFWTGSYPVLRGYAIYANLGYSAEGATRWHLATALWREAVPLVAQAGNRPTEGLARFQLASAEIAAGEKKEAARELDRATQIFSALPRTDASRNYLVASEVALASVDAALGDHKTAANLLARVEPDLVNVSQQLTALQYFELLAKEQMISGDARHAKENLQVAMAIIEKGNDSLSSDAERLRWEEHVGRAYRDLIQLSLRENGGENAALAVWEQYRSNQARTIQSVPAPAHSSKLDLAEISFHPPAIPAVDLQSVIPKAANISFVTYARLDDSYVVWIFDNRGIAFRRISAPAAVIDASIKRFARLCADPESNPVALRADSRQIYQWLLVPLEAFFDPSRTIWIEPDGALASLPFQALTNPQNIYFGRQFDVAYRSGLPQPAAQPEPLVTRADRALVVGLPSSAENSHRPLPALSDAERESRDVAGQFQKSKLVVGGNPDWDAVRAELAEVNLVHYAGHYFPQEDALFLLLTSANRGSVKTRSTELAHCKLVVLSACSTGLARELGFVNSEGLVRPLLQAGAKRVVASQWDVDSTSTAILMDAFYSSLLSGKSAPAALRVASGTLAARPEYSHPYYWAGFDVFAKD